MFKISSNYTIQVIFIVIGILASAFFSSSETAITSTSKIKIRQLVNKGKKNARILQKLVDDKNNLITTILVGNNIVNILTTTIATLFFTDLLGASGAFVSTVVMTLSVLIFGEITPKTLASVKNEKISLKVSRPIYILSILLRPLVFILSFITGKIIALFVGENKEDEAFTEDDIKTLVGVSNEQGAINKSEKEFINRVFEFDDLYVEDIMTPRTSVEAINVEITAEELVEFLNNTNHSRFPVYKDTIDNILGIVHIKDITMMLVNEKKIDFEKLARKTYVAFEYQYVINLFKEMTEKKLSMAIVVDEYGGMSGVVTIEDIVEELVGDIVDEYDKEGSIIKIADTNSYFVDSSMDIEEINEKLALNLVPIKNYSIGGLAIDCLNRLAKTGDSVTTQGIKIDILQVERFKITKLKLTIL